MIRTLGMLLVFLTTVAIADRGPKLSIPHELDGRAERLLTLKCKNGKEVAFRDYRYGSSGNEKHVSYTVPRYYPAIDSALVDHGKYLLGEKIIVSLESCEQFIYASSQRPSFSNKGETTNYFLAHGENYRGIKERNFVLLAKCTKLGCKQIFKMDSAVKYANWVNANRFVVMKSKCDEQKRQCKKDGAVTCEIENDKVTCS